MTKLFKVPFATQGDRAAIPDEVRADGAVSYTQGYGYDYERDQTTDPAAKDIEREKMNSLFHDITEAVGEMQSFGVPVWQEAGKPYAVRSIVYHKNKTWQSKIENNTTEPVAGTAWAELKADLTAGEVGAYSKGESDQKFQPAGNYLPEGYSYSKAESDTNFQPKGNYATKSELINGLAGKQPVGDYATKTESNGKLAKDKNGADIPDKSEFINNLGLSEKFQPKGNYQPAGNYYVFSDITTMPERGFNGVFSGGVSVKYIKGFSISSGSGGSDTAQLYIDHKAGLTVRYLNNNGAVNEDKIVGIPIGATIEWQSAVAIPDGFLINDGREFNASLYPMLAKVFPDLKLPDDRGLFKRALDNGRGYDSGRKLGSFQNDAMQNLTGNFGNPTIEGGDFSEGVFRHSVNKGGRAAGANANSISYSFDASRQVRTAHEFRPVNKAVIYITRVI